MKLKGICGIAFVAFLALIACGCQSSDDNEPKETPREGLTIELKEGMLRTRGATIVITNDSADEYLHQQTFLIQERIDGVWAEIEKIPSPPRLIPSLGYCEFAYSSTEYDIRWDSTYGVLPHGQYRLIWNNIQKAPFGEYQEDLFDLVVEFEIAEKY